MAPRKRLTQQAMYLVSQVSELNFFLGRFAPRVTLRLAPDSVEVSSSDGHFRAAPVVVFVKDGDRRRVAGIGDDCLANATSGRVNIFTGAATREHTTTDNLVETFLHAALRRLPKSCGIPRAVVVVENLNSLDSLLSGRHREIIASALERWGAAATVMS